MPPQLAASLTGAFVLYLLWRDARARSGTGLGLWIATLWFVILASRVPSYWFQSGTGDISVGAYEEGNSFNQIVYLTLILAGFVVLLRRRVKWLEIIGRNRALFLYLGFSFVSFVWADYPFVSFKGSVKALFGNPVMALLILTNPNPAEAIRAVIRRCAFVVIPFSVVAIKWFPQVGREIHRFSDETIYTGIATGSNGLSTACFVCGLLIVWELIRRGSLDNRREFVIHLIILVMILWLFTKGDGATAGAAMLLGTTLLLSLRFGLFREKVLTLGRNIGIVLILLSPVVVMNYSWFLDTVSSLFGRETLWGRLEVWGRVVAMVDNPLLGVGYNSFWQGERLAVLWGSYWWRPTQAHNGYVETYLNLGWIGVALLVAMIVVAGRRIGDRRLQPELLYLKAPYVVPILFFNLTESAFRGLHVIWFVFLLVTLETRQQLQGDESLVSADHVTPARPPLVNSHWRPIAGAVATASVRATRWGRRAMLSPDPAPPRAVAHRHWGVAVRTKPDGQRRG